MWRQAQRTARQAFSAFSSSSAFARAAAPQVSAGCGKAAMKAAATSGSRAGGGLAGSTCFQSFKQGMGARSMMGFAASAPCMSSSTPCFMGQSSTTQAGSGSAVTSSGESSDDDSSPTNRSSTNTSLSGSDDEEESSVKRRRTERFPRKGFDNLSPSAAPIAVNGGLSAAAAAATILFGQPTFSTSSHLFLGKIGLPAQYMVNATSALASKPCSPSMQCRGLHTAQPLLFAGPTDSSRQRGGSSNMSFTRPATDLLTQNLIFTQDSFLKKDKGAIAIPMPVREVMYQHRWDKLLVDVRRAVSYVRTEGKREQYTAMVAVGNMKGLFGLGLGDAPTAQEAVAAAYMDAFNKLTVIPLYRGHTIFNHIEHRYNALKFLISPRQDGWGITANDLLLELCNLAGIRNISIKVYGRRRPKFYMAAGFLEALQHQSVPHDGVEGSGIYVREILPAPRQHRAP